MPFLGSLGIIFAFSLDILDALIKHEAETLFSAFEVSFFPCLKLSEGSSHLESLADQLDYFSRMG